MGLRIVSVKVLNRYEKYILKKDIYSRKLLKLPTPRFIVFYNGAEQQPEQKLAYCIANGILKDFLSENKAEVIKMTIFEYDEELHKKTLHD
ncbi:MAG: hypothetical protein ACI4DO_01430, partial [Roseburia sp.]